MTSGPKRLQQACVWAGPVFLVGYAIGFWGIAHFIPPPSPSMSSVNVAHLFQAHHARIRIGMVIGLISSILLLPYFAAISAQIARIEKRSPVLAMIQFGGGVLLVVFFGVCSMLWITATFRGDLDPQTVRMLNDFSWLTFVMVFPGYSLQLICMAIAGFMDTSETPVWPRWASYLNLWVAITGMGGGLAVFFKSGPFAWNGLVGFYLPLSVFAVWITTMTYLLHTGIGRQAAQAQPLAAGRLEV